MVLFFTCSYDLVGSILITMDSRYTDSMYLRCTYTFPNFREMLDTVVRINFRGSNFRGTRAFVLSTWMT